jgi:hypothetical protein
MALQEASEAYLVSLFEEISVRTPDSPSTSDISVKTLIETFALAHNDVVTSTITISDFFRPP